MPKHIKTFLKVKNLDITVGLDRAEPNMISKQSPCGLTFEKIKKHIEQLKEANIEISINSVLTEKNYKDIQKVIDFTRDNKIKIRVTEEGTYKVLTNGLMTRRFRNFITRTAKKYDLKNFEKNFVKALSILELPEKKVKQQFAS